jgi:hypothetical protein
VVLMSPHDLCFVTCGNIPRVPTTSPWTEASNSWRPSAVAHGTGRPLPENPASDSETAPVVTCPRTGD